MRSWWRWGLVVILRRFSWNQLDEESDEDKRCPMSCHLVPMGNVSCSSSKGNLFLYHGIDTLTRFPWAMLGSIDKSNSTRWCL